MKSKLDKAIEAAEEKVSKVDWNNPMISIVDKMRPYVQLQHLLLIKIELLLEKENDDNGNKQN